MQTDERSMKAEIFVPSTLDVRRPAPPEMVREWVDAAIALLATRAGGCTVTAAQGAYVARDGAIVRETVHVVWTYVDNDALRGELCALAERMATAMGQESVMVAFGDRPTFVPPVSSAA